MGIITPETLIGAYKAGIFPMAPSKNSGKVYWYQPVERGIIPLENFHVSRNVMRMIRNKPHTVKLNANFKKVIELCGARQDTWISETIIKSYLMLHHLGLAHSIEIYQSEDLVGGLYGVALGGAFFGESMFRLRPEMDKFALYYCHKRLAERKFTLWDTQFYTEHLGTFGCIEIPQFEYMLKLQEALKVSARFFP
jgi:leucyl/phenylalanyl-tRNA--protein transferase